MKSTIDNLFSQIDGYQPDSAMPQNIADQQLSAVAFIKGNRFNFAKNEIWRNVDFSAFMNEELVTPCSNETNPESNFTCNIPNLDTIKLNICNGFFQAGQPLQELENGVIIGSLNAAMKKHPSLVEKIFGKAATRNNSFLAANTALYSDGIFVYIPDNVTIERPLQMLEVINSGAPLFLQTRNLVYLGKNSRLTLIHCDDSYNQNRSFSNIVTEIVLDRHAHLEHYKMQNLNDNSGLLNQTFVSMEDNSVLLSNSISLNGGNIRNHNEVRMNGEHCDTQVHGLYLMDKEQKIDNYVFVEHSKPNCESNELFKGILDDGATGHFNGHVLVCEGATKTLAYQSNKNILLTDKATINTKPFLEIYNDDVKCSHGTTTGQLDEQMLFYIRSRGISERTAKTLLMYAFCDEVIQKIALEPLRIRISDMVKKRLHGELSICENCALHCSSPDYHFSIDASKI